MIAIIVITPEMIEAAAIALRNATGNKSGKGKPWAKLPDNIRKMYRAEAEVTLRTALAVAEANEVA
jgi:hypothetical protein